jgi:hypothetical protein
MRHALATHPDTHRSIARLRRDEITRDVLEAHAELVVSGLIPWAQSLGAGFRNASAG